MAKLKFETNRIYQGDNLYYMPDMPKESIDLIYIDPPFGTQSLLKSKAFKEKVQDLQFYDIFGGGVNGYINFMVPRLRQMHRLLKPTGSLFVHLDWRMAHYIKTELDKIFGVTNPASTNTNFVNEIIWHYKSGGNSKRFFAKKHDTILWYSKTKKYKFNFNDIAEKRGVKKRNNMKKNVDNNGKIYYSIKSNGKIYKYYEDHKMAPSDVFDIPHLQQKDPERTGWPTQKPLALLNRIIKATTKPGDLVADFFCGCGTAIVAAQRLDRKWIGMDASKTACEVMLKRIKKDQPVFNHGIVSKPMTLEDFKRLSPFDFEKEAIRCVGGVSNYKQVGDGGIDGRMAFDGTPIQVKKHNKPIGNDEKFRGFYELLRTHKRGIYISLNGYTPGAKEKADEWRRQGLDIQLLTIEHLLKGQFRGEQSQSVKKAA